MDRTKFLGTALLIALTVGCAGTNRPTLFQRHREAPCPAPEMEVPSSTPCAGACDGPVIGGMPVATGPVIQPGMMAPPGTVTIPGPGMTLPQGTSPPPAAAPVGPPPRTTPQTNPTSSTHPAKS